MVVSINYFQNWVIISQTIDAWIRRTDNLVLNNSSRDIFLFALTILTLKICFIWSILIYTWVPDTSDTNATRVQHEWDTNDTSAIQVRHQCYTNDTNETWVLHERHECGTSEKSLILITARMKTNFHTLIFTIWQVKDYRERNNFIRSNNFRNASFPCQNVFEKCTTKTDLRRGRSYIKKLYTKL